VAVVLVIVNGVPTVNGELLATGPPGVVTIILPVVAPAGKVAVICVVLFTVNVAAVPLKVTELTFEKLVPVITTEVPLPWQAEVGVKLDIVGGGCEGTVHVNVKPLTGRTVLLIVHVEPLVLTAAVVLDQFVVVVLPWKSEVAAPVMPTYTV
jgi:hypothetical protein